MYLLTNTNTARIFFLKTQHVFVLLIMDMESAKTDINGPNKKVCFLYFFNKKSDKKINK